MLTSQSAKATLNEELEGMFDGMINSTSGGSYETQRRGVITGGNLAIRNKLSNPDLVSFVPPNVKAGCGGIDMFGGSFSYVNGEQFTQLMRGIAQAAVGYAFSLAIEGMCPTCAQVITKLQNDVKFINGLMKDSCESAKFLVDSTIGPSIKAVNNSLNQDLNSELSSSGFLEDFFSGFNSAESPGKKAIDNGKKDLISSNIVHKALKSSNAKAWFKFGDDEWERVMMSLTGTYVSRPNDDETDIKYEFRVPKMNPKDLIEGGEITVFKCESSDCLLPGGDTSTETITIIGMRERVRKMLFGTGYCDACTGGIIRKMHARDGGDAFSDEEVKFITATSPGVQGLLSRLATEPQAMALIGERLINVLAVEMVNQLVDEVYDTVNNAIAAQSLEMDTKMLGAMRDRKEKIDSERAQAGATLVGISNLLEMRAEIEKDLREPADRKSVV